MWRVQCRLPSPVAEALRGTLAGCPQRFSSARETLPPRSRVAPAGVEADPDSSAPPTSQAAHRPRAAASTPDATPRGSRATARCVPLLPARLPLHRRRPDPRAFGNVPPAPPPRRPSSPDAAGARMVPSHHPRPHRRRRPPRRVRRVRRRPRRGGRPIPPLVHVASADGASLWFFAAGVDTGKIAVARVDEAGVRHEMGEAVLPEDTDDEGARSSPLVTAVVAAPTSRGGALAVAGCAGGELFLVECTRRGRVTVAAMDRGTRADVSATTPATSSAASTPTGWGAAALSATKAALRFLRDERTSDDATGAVRSLSWAPAAPASFACSVSPPTRWRNGRWTARAGADAVWCGAIARSRR